MTRSQIGYGLLAAGIILGGIGGIFHLNESLLHLVAGLTLALPFIGVAILNRTD